MVWRVLLSFIVLLMIPAVSFADDCVDEPQLAWEIALTHEKPELYLAGEYLLIQSPDQYTVVFNQDGQVEKEYEATFLINDLGNSPAVLVQDMGWILVFNIEEIDDRGRYMWAVDYFDQFNELLTNSVVRTTTKIHSLHDTKTTYGYCLQSPFTVIECRGLTTDNQKVTYLQSIGHCGMMLEPIDEGRSTHTVLENGTIIANDKHGLHAFRLNYDHSRWYYTGQYVTELWQYNKELYADSFVFGIGKLALVLPRNQQSINAFNSDGLQWSQHYHCSSDLLVEGSCKAVMNEDEYILFAGPNGTRMIIDPEGELTYKNEVCPIAQAIASCPDIRFAIAQIDFPLLIINEYGETVLELEYSNITSELIEIEGRLYFIDSNQLICLDLT